MARAAPRDDGDEGASGDAPERTCAVTRERLAPADLIRFVQAPDGSIVPDLGLRLPGRGVWVRLDRGAVEAAARQNAFARSLKRPVTVPDDLPDRVEQLLRRRCLEALAMANKAGLVVAGFGKVDEALGKGKVLALVHATEAAADGRGRLDRKLAAIEAGRGTGTPAAETAAADMPRVVIELTGDELSLALGRENVVHAAVSKGGAAQHFLIEAGRFRRYRLNSHVITGRPPRTRRNTEQV